MLNPYTFTLLNLRLLLLLLALPTISIPAISQKNLYDLDEVRDIKLQFAEQNWDDILDSLKMMDNDDRLIAKLTVDGVTYDSVGVRYKGNSSYHNVRKTKSSKLPFNIKLNEIKKEQRLPDDIKTLKLSNVFRDPSFLREVMSYEIAGQYMPAPRANYARLYVNGEYLGLYNNSESIDKRFLEKYFAWDDGTLVKCDPTWDADNLEGCLPGDKASLMYQGEDSICYQKNYELKSDYGWASLIQLTKLLHDEKRDPAEMLNVDQALWMLAFNNVLVNLDSYSGRLCHNYYLYQDSFGIFHPLVWDMNLSFGGFRFDGTNKKAMTDEELQEFSMFTHYTSPNRPLISRLLGIPLYRKIYLAHIQTILDDYFTNGKYIERGQHIQTVISSYVQEDANKLYAHQSFINNLDETEEAGTSNIIGIRELMAKRSEYLGNHPLLKKEQPTISDVKHAVSAAGIKISAKVEKVEAVHLFYRTKVHAPFNKAEMQSSAASQYTAKLDKSKVLEYYIVAENEKTASLSPVRAAFEYHSISDKK